MPGRLEGKVAAITGGASGFGAGAARRFVTEGANVVIGDIQIEAGQAVADELGDACVFIKCDVTVEDEVAALVDTAVSNFGQLDIMYNNAGVVGAVGPIATTPAEEWNKTMDIHVNGVFYGCKHAARVMTPRGTGSIVNMSSEAGISGGRGPHAYAAAKHAIIGITKNVAVELAQHNIRVNAICPGILRTQMWEYLAEGWKRPDESKEQSWRRILASQIPLGRPQTPEDIGQLAVYLAHAKNVTGQAINVDGGQAGP